MRQLILNLLFFSFSLLLSDTTLSAQASQAEVTVLNRDREPVQEIIDGDSVLVRVTRKNVTAQPLNVHLGFKVGETPIANIAIPANEPQGSSSLFTTLGWHWNAGQQPQPLRRIYVWTENATTGDFTILGTAEVWVQPRPVVLVHGFISNAAAWNAYLGPEGFLGSLGLRGFAVGDGQAAGRLNTGNVLAPTQPTNTIAQNAEILRDYIAGVKQITGASHVDLVAHSMGGLISRYYIDRLMQTRDVAQLIMLGSPHGGSDCANISSTLGFYLPAALELRPDYVTNIFNKQITRRKGINFHFLAGTPITEPFKCPCTGVPSDLVVSLSSAAVIAGADSIASLPVLHTDMTSSVPVFREFVEPLLCKTAGQFPVVRDPVIAETTPQKFQFSRVFTGQVTPDSSAEIVINIEENVAVASFALYDRTRSLTVTVRGASGNVIQLDAEKHGLRIIDDPSTLVYMGYGFDHPKPGPWRVTVQPTDATPPEGARFAIVARLQGGTTLVAATDVLLPQINQPVELRAQLDLGGEALPIHKAEATIRSASSEPETVPLRVAGNVLHGTWQPKQAGIIGVDLVVEALLAENVMVNRSAFLVLEVQSKVNRKWLILVAGVAVLFVLIFMSKRLRRRWKQRSSDGNAWRVSQG